MTKCSEHDHMLKGPVAVVGASGFVGASVVDAFRQLSCEVVAVKAPRLVWSNPKCTSAQEALKMQDNSLRRLSTELAGCEVVINAAGISDSLSRDPLSLLAANALVPLAIAHVCREIGIQRFIQISTAAVQGDLRSLDSSTEHKPLSSYAKSKALSEILLMEEVDPTFELVIFRPPSVHAAGRRVTESIRKLGSLRVLTVVDQGSRPAPHALLKNVADAIAFLATTQVRPPQIVHYPWEGLTARDFITVLTGRQPHSIPRTLALPILSVAKSLERAVPNLAPHRRRLEVLWLGQDISSSWLDHAGWKPPLDRDAWSSLSHH